MAEKVCPRCKGTGLSDKYSEEDCDYCDGDGYVILAPVTEISRDRKTSLSRQTS